MDRRLERPRQGATEPSWWKGDEDASRSALAAARAMGVRLPASVRL